MINATEPTPRETLPEAIARLGLSIRAEFVPYSQSRNKGEKNLSLNWRVTLRKTHPDFEAAPAILTTDYSAGIAHCPAYKAKDLGMPNCIDRTAAIKAECETGKVALRYVSGKPILPDTTDVIYSLVSESDVLDYGSFEDWAREFGYDLDSRKAEGIYRACLEIALKLRNGIGEKALTELREAAQEY